MAARELGNALGNPLARARCGVTSPAQPANSMKIYASNRNILSTNQYFSNAGDESVAPTIVCFNTNEIFAISSISGMGNGYLKWVLNDGLTTLASTALAPITFAKTVDSRDVFNITHSPTVRISQGGMVITYASGAITTSRLFPASGTFTVGGTGFSSSVVHQVLQKTDGYIIVGTVSTNFAFIAELDSSLNVVRSASLGAFSTPGAINVHIDTDFGYVVLVQGLPSSGSPAVISLNTTFGQIYKNTTLQYGVVPLYSFYDSVTKIAAFFSATSNTSTVSFLQLTTSGALSGSTNASYGYLHTADTSYREVIAFGMKNHKELYPKVSSLRTADGLGLQMINVPGMGGGNSSCSDYTSYPCKRVRLIGVDGGMCIPQFEYGFAMTVKLGTSLSGIHVRTPVEIDRDRCVVLHASSTGTSIEVASLTSTYTY